MEGCSIATTVTVHGWSSTAVGRCWRCTSRPETSPSRLSSSREQLHRVHPAGVASKFVQIVTNLDSPPWEGERTGLSIGAYDGVHRGHQAVIQAVRRLASESGAKAAVMTFDRHPASVVRPESAPKLLTDVDQKLELLAATGLDATIIIHFDEEQSREEPAHFVRRVLIDCLNTSVVVVGEDFHFGRGREGNVEMLRRLGADGNFQVQPLELVPRSDGVDESISSTAIRRALAGGQVELAADLLGRPFEARGIVVAGDQRGRLLGFPTANVEVPNAVCVPADGVYAGYYERPNGEIHECALNLGRRPTFYEHADHSLLEAHLLDFEGDLYGERAEVRFTHFLRSERKFNGVDALIEQLKHDIEHARNVLRTKTGREARRGKRQRRAASGARRKRASER